MVRDKARASLHYTTTTGMQACRFSKPVALLLLSIAWCHNQPGMPACYLNGLPMFLTEGVTKLPFRKASGGGEELLSRALTCRMGWVAGDVNERLRRYLAVSGGLHKASALKQYAEHLRKSGQAGQAEAACKVCSYEPGKRTSA